MWLVMFLTKMLILSSGQKKTVVLIVTTLITQNLAKLCLLVQKFIIIYYWYSALGPVWAETRVQSGDWYGSGTLHPGQVVRGSLPLLSPTF